MILQIALRICLEHGRATQRVTPLGQGGRRLASEVYSWAGLGNGLHPGAEKHQVEQNPMADLARVSVTMMVRGSAGTGTRGTSVMFTHPFDLLKCAAEGYTQTQTHTWGTARKEKLGINPLHGQKFLILI